MTCKAIRLRRKGTLALGHLAFSRYVAIKQIQHKKHMPGIETYVILIIVHHLTYTDYISCSVSWFVFLFITSYFSFHSFLVFICLLYNLSLSLSLSIHIYVYSTQRRSYQAEVSMLTQAQGFPGILRLIDAFSVQGVSLP